MQGAIIVIHPDTYTSIANVGFDPSTMSEWASLSFLHIKTSLSSWEIIRQIKLAICENRRQILFTWLEAVAGTENPYSLVQVLGPGHVVTKSGATVYVTKCVAVSVEPRAATICTQEIPVKLIATRAYVDPITFVIQYVGTITHCNLIAPQGIKLQANGIAVIRTC